MLVYFVSNSAHVNSSHHACRDTALEQPPAQATGQRLTCSEGHCNLTLSPRKDRFKRKEGLNVAKQTFPVC